MKFTYTHLAGQTSENALDDLVALSTLKGTTTLPTLSAKCNLGATNVEYNEENNWELWDRQPTYAVLRSECVDSGLYKYLRITLTGNDKSFTIASFEDWNKTTHVGVNQSGGNGVFLEGIMNKLNTNLSITVYATNRMWVAIPSGLTYFGFTGLMEFSREDLRNHPSPYPCFTQFQFCCDSNIYPLIQKLADGGHTGIPRYKAMDKVGDYYGNHSLSDAIANVLIHGSRPFSDSSSSANRTIAYVNSISSTKLRRDSDDKTYYGFESPAVSVWPGPSSTTVDPNTLGKLIDLKIWATTPVVAIGEDIIANNNGVNTTYRVIATNIRGVYVAVRKV